MRYLCRRLGHGALVLAGVSVLSFVFTALAPGDFLSEMKLDPRISPETVAALRTRYGLDQPLPLKYIRWLESVRRGDLGFSFAYNSPVASLLWPRARNTLLLTVPATALAWLGVAVPLGAWSASQSGRWGDRLCAGATTALLGVPDLVLGLMLLLLRAHRVFSDRRHGSTRFAELGTWGKVEDLTFHLFLPASALVC
jgi:peptide/nickel transport system permease protein